MTPKADIFTGDKEILDGLVFVKDNYKKGLEKVFDVDADFKDVKLLDILSVASELFDGYKKFGSLMGSMQSEGKFLKAFEEVSKELAKLEKKMTERLAQTADLVRGKAFENKIEIPVKKMSEALANFYENPTLKNKKEFIETVKFSGPAVNILTRIRDQLPAMLLDIKKDSDGYKGRARVVGMLIFQVVTINCEYLLARWSDEKHAGRNDQYHYELMATIRDIYGVLGIEIPLPKFDADAITGVVKNIASSSNVAHREVRIYEELKKKYPSDMFLVLAYHGDHCQSSKIDDGSTVVFSDKENTYVVHRFNVILPKSHHTVLEGRGAATEAFLSRTQHFLGDYTTVAKAVSDKTHYFAVYCQKSTDCGDYELNYKADPVVEGCFHVFHKVIDVDPKLPMRLQEGTLVATFV